MQLNAWVSQNNDQSNGPGQSARSITVSFVPELTGKNPQFAGGKVVGAINLQNLTDELAAQFAGGAEFEITITPKAQS